MPVASYRNRKVDIRKTDSLLKLKHITQREFSHKLGFTNTWFSNFVSRNKNHGQQFINMSDEILFKTCEVLSCQEADILFSGQVDEKKDVPKVKLVRVYRETISELLGVKGLSSRQFSSEMTHSEQWLSVGMERHGGYMLFNPMDVKLACYILGCNIERLTEIPRRKKVEESEKAVSASPDIDISELLETIQTGFQMLHRDLRKLYEVWKPESVDEPKYAIKEREDS